MWSKNILDSGQFDWVVHKRASAVGVDQINWPVVDDTGEESSQRRSGWIDAGQMGCVAAQGETIDAGEDFPAHGPGHSCTR